MTVDYARISGDIAEISAWVDEYNLGIDRNHEALGWHRVAKTAEEAGEAIGAWLLYTGGNPRKPAGPLQDVIEELLDTAIAALGAVEHLTGNLGLSVEMMAEKALRVHSRAGLS